MAAAEARAVWQRTANRCFMQEDAKRAPKLACCPSTVPSKSQSDSSNFDAVNGAGHSTAGKLPVNRNSSNNLSPETRWWLQLQPSFGNQRDCASENVKQMNFETVDAEMDHEIPRNHNSSSELPENADPVLVDSVVQNSSCGEGKALNNQNMVFKSVDNKGARVENSYDLDAREDPKSSNQDYDWKISKTEDLAILEGYEKYAYDITSKSSDKGGLWWRTADENELATLVAQKSSEHIENCDLPPPQFNQKRKGPFPSEDKLCYGEFSESIVRYQEVCADSIGLSVSSSFSKGSNPTSPFSVHRNMDTGPFLAGESHYPSINAVERASSSSGTNRTWSGRQSFESEGDKAQLLQALCHSQTRAREAEEAAAQAFSEKEQLVRLFLKEASHLFAYRQWLQLLQLETLCLKAKDQSVSWDQLKSLFPLFPWIPTKHQKWAGSNASSSKRHKVGRQKFDTSAWALAMALGLSLAGAGLFIGWSMGWLLPMF